jgi:hypothetical protein
MAVVSPSYILDLLLPQHWVSLSSSACVVCQFSGGCEDVQRFVRIDYVCFAVELLQDHQGRARRALVLAGAVSVVYRVSEGGAAVLGHFAVAAQYMLFRICWAAWVGPAAPGCPELPGRLVLICEEGLVPPINTIVQINVFGQCYGNKRDGNRG